MEKSPEDFLPKQGAVSGKERSVLQSAVHECAPALLWSTDTDLHFTALAGAELEMLDIQAESYLGMAVEASILSLGNDVLISHRKALLGDAAVFEMELGGRDFSARVEPVYSSDGNIIGVSGVAIDNTARLVSERALRLSEQSSRLLIEEIPFAICRCSKSGQLLQVNRAMLEMLGYDASSEAELLVRDLPNDVFAAEGTFAAFLNKLLEHDTVRGFECRWHCRSGKQIEVSVGGRMVRDKEGELWYLDLLAENVTERNQLESEWRQMQKMQAVGQLAGGVAHDFNNLLMVIRGQVELLLTEAIEPDIRHRLEEVMHASERASSLTRQLLAFSRKQVLQNRVLEINSLVERISSLLTPLITENVEFIFVPSSMPAYVRADSNQIEQMLMNLAVNARDAMPGGGRLIIEISQLEGSVAHPVTAKSDGYVLIAVRDTGHGMSEEVRARIFEPFFTTKEPGSGTGLGLALVYGVVQQSGGQIFVESEPGRGASFSIYLPRVIEPEVKTPKQESIPMPWGNETILYAEDEESVRGLIGQYLTNLGYRVLTAGDGAVALAAVQEHDGPIDLLLSDMMMPKMGGRELAEELRKKLPGLKVLFVSGYVGHSLAGKNMELPNTHFLAKPFSMQTLAKTIREFLDKKPTKRHR